MNRPFNIVSQKTSDTADLGAQLLRALNRLNPDNACALALIAAGADVARRDMLGRTSVHYAALMGADVAVAAALVEKGANPYIKDGFGQTGLSYAEKYDRPALAVILRQSAHPVPDPQAGQLRPRPPGGPNG